MSKSCSKPLICIYANKEKNEFAIGLKEDETFREVILIQDLLMRLRILCYKEKSQYSVIFD
ncbi:MAG: hypothetical protein WAM14_22355 [Candidatus Nitrosopolaris sp.]